MEQHHIILQKISYLRKLKHANQKPETVPQALKKYEPFKDDSLPVILDIEEERQRQSTNSQYNSAPKINLMEEISNKCGVHGVFDIEELVHILKRENALDVCVISVPPEYRYVKHMVIVSGKTFRHMSGMTDFVRRVYKYKTGGKPGIPMIEGEKSPDWMALDLGNIALHVFSKSKREEYDLESLWSVGAELDRLTQQPEQPVLQMLRENVDFHPTGGGDADKTSLCS